MTESPRLTLVQAALEEVGAPTEAAKLKATKELLARYAPSIAKRARQDREAEILAEAGAKAVSDLTLLPALKAAHEAEMLRMAKLIAPKSLYKGLMIGLVGCLFSAAMGVLLGYSLFRDGVTTNVAAQRVDLSSPPVLEYQSAPETYEPGRTEPASAP